jgi:hypothetical protein
MNLGGVCFCLSLVQEWKMTLLFGDLQSLTRFASHVSAMSAIQACRPLDLRGVLLPQY